MDTSVLDLRQRFPELSDPERTIERIAEAFVAPEYARAGFALIRRIVERNRERIDFGRATVITAPYGYEPIIVTVSNWWALAFHTAPADELASGDYVEPVGPYDYDDVLRRSREDESEDRMGRVGGAELDEIDEVDEDELDDLDDDEEIELTLYQVGTFLLDSTIIPREEIFDRDDLECYAFDYPEDRVEAERFYWARLAWEPEDLNNEDLLAAIDSSFEFIIANYGHEAPLAEFHDSDFAQLIMNEALCERAIGAADFGDIITVEGHTDGQ